MKKLVFLGKRGRTTIPLIMRFRHDYHDNDLISFEDNEDGSITIRHECMCDENCPIDCSDSFTLYDIVNCLSESEKEHLLVYLAKSLNEIEVKRYYANKDFSD